MLEFKLQYYFEKYKNTCVISAPKFKNTFIRKEGEFELLNELLVMIQRYQIKKYHDLIPSGNKTGTVVKRGTYGKLENQRNIHRFGSKEERQIRKLNEKWRIQ